jgi:hypothetical protein
MMSSETKHSSRGILRTYYNTLSTGSSPFSHILNTDLDPSDAQARRAMSVWFQEATRVQTPVLQDCSQLDLDLVLSREQGLQDPLSIVAIRGSEMLIHKMPWRVLERIFVSCLPQEGTCVPRALRSPLVLCQVCKYWRDCAILMPQLWSSLCVEMTATGCIPRLPLIEVWLSRSGTCALTLSILHPYASRNTSSSFGRQTSRHPEDTNAVLSVFLQYFTRWKEVLLELHGNAYPALQEALYDSISLLETFTLLTSVGFCMNTTMALSRMFQATPYLRNVSWTQYRDQLVPTFPWAALTSLHVIASLSISDCLGILREGVNLVDCSFLRVALPSQNLIYAPFRMPEMRVFELCSKMDIGPLLDYLTLPLVERIRISFLHTSHNPRRWPHLQFLSLLSRSQCSLQWLTLTDAPISEDELLQCLQQVQSSLFGLSIDNSRHFSCVSEVLIYPLTVGKLRGPCLCPRLRSITLRGCISTMDGVIADMVESRWKIDQSMEEHAATLEYVEIRLRIGHDQDIRRLGALRYEGLDVRIDVNDLGA